MVELFTFRCLDGYPVLVMKPADCVTAIRLPTPAALNEPNESYTRFCHLAFGPSPTDGIYTHFDHYGFNSLVRFEVCLGRPYSYMKTIG